MMCLIFSVTDFWNIPAVRNINVGEALYGDYGISDDLSSLRTGKSISFMVYVAGGSIESRSTWYWLVKNASSMKVSTKMMN